MSPVFRIPLLLLPRAHVQSLVEELRSHKPNDCGGGGWGEALSILARKKALLGEPWASTLAQIQNPPSSNPTEHQSSAWEGGTLGPEPGVYY